ncbi:MAG: cytochrome c [Geminicoccaceae bacterium]
MGEGLTKAMARNIFYGGSVFFFLLFTVLVIQSHWYATTTAISGDPLDDAVIRGKRVWEKHACIDCHTIFGEGAYFAPELGNVFVRYGGKDDPEGARESLKAWILSQPTGIEGRRQMPKFDLTDQELDDLVRFLEWASKVDTQGWPPNEAG